MAHFSLVNVKLQSRRRFMTARRLLSCSACVLPYRPIYHPMAMFKQPGRQSSVGGREFSCVVGPPAWHYGQCEVSLGSTSSSPAVMLWILHLYSTTCRTRSLYWHCVISVCHLCFTFVCFISCICKGVNGQLSNFVVSPAPCSHHFQTDGRRPTDDLTPITHPVNPPMAIS